MGSVPADFYLASAAVGQPEAIEPEGGGSDVSQNWDTLGWGYWSSSFVPTVDKWKWLYPRHLTNICARWNQNHTDDMQHAFFNGDGFETWENVW